MIDEKIVRYKNNIKIAEKLRHKNYADKGYYEELILKMNKILMFYEKLKKFKENEQITNRNQ